MVLDAHDNVRKIIQDDEAIWDKLTPKKILKTKS